MHDTWCHVIRCYLHAQNRQTIHIGAVISEKAAANGGNASDGGQSWQKGYGTCGNTRVQRPACKGHAAYVPHVMTPLCPSAYRLKARSTPGVSCLMHLVSIPCFLGLSSHRASHQGNSGLRRQVMGPCQCALHKAQVAHSACVGPWQPWHSTQKPNVSCLFLQRL